MSPKLSGPSLESRPHPFFFAVTALHSPALGLPQPEHLATLNAVAITQMRTLLTANPGKRLK